MTLLGENARVKDVRSRGKAADTDARSGPEPINFRALDPSVFEELLHRFRPRVCINLTAGCPTSALPFLLKGLPFVAICAWVQSVFFVMKIHQNQSGHGAGLIELNRTCSHLGHTPEHCKWFKEQAAKMLFQSFCQVGSANYDARLAKALKIEDASGTGGTPPPPVTGGTGRGAGTGRGRGRGQVA